MTQESREKYWQTVAGKMATIANWALNELIRHIRGKDGDPNADDKAEEYLLEVIQFIDFDEEIIL